MRKTIGLLSGLFALGLAISAAQAGMHHANVAADCGIKTCGGSCGNKNQVQNKHRHQHRYMCRHGKVAPVKVTFRCETIKQLVCGQDPYEFCTTVCNTQYLSVDKKGGWKHRHRHHGDAGPHQHHHRHHGPPERQTTTINIENLVCGNETQTVTLETPKGHKHRHHHRHIYAHRVEDDQEGQNQHQHRHRHRHQWRWAVGSGVEACYVICELGVPPACDEDVVAQPPTGGSSAKPGKLVLWMEY